MVKIWDLGMRLDPTSRLLGMKSRAWLFCYREPEWQSLLSQDPENLLAVDSSVIIVVDKYRLVVITHLAIISSLIYLSAQPSKSDPTRAGRRNGPSSSAKHHLD